MPQSFKAKYYDGKTSQSYPVTLTKFGDSLEIKGERIDCTLLLNSIRFEDSIGSTPLTAFLPNGGKFEVSRAEIGADSWDVVFPRKSEIIRLLERGWRGLILSLLVVGLGGYLSVAVLLPQLAPVIARNLPDKFTAALDSAILSSVDETFFEASTLSARKQAEIVDDWREFCKSAGIECEAPVRFRNSKKLGANAAALPGGSFIVTDELVELAGDTKYIIAVLAHEQGHAEGKHALNSLVHAGALTFLVAFATGDVSSAASLSAITLMQLTFSRSQEFEADRYAKELLEKVFGTAEPLATMLERMTSPGLKSFETYGQYLSTHPATGDRIRILRGSAKPGSRPKYPD